MDTEQEDFEILEHEKYDAIEVLSTIKKSKIIHKCVLGVSVLFIVIQILNGENLADMLNLNTVAAVLNSIVSVGMLIGFPKLKEVIEEYLIKINQNISEQKNTEDKIR